MNATPLAQDDMHEIIDRERRRDRVLRRIGFVAWAITFVMLLIFAAFTTANIVRMKQMLAAGVVGEDAVAHATIPLVAVIGVLSLLIATLTTVGIFLRFRTANLIEIQHRLATLEEMIAGRN